MVIIRLKFAQVREECVVRLLAPEPVQRAIGQNAMKQHGELFNGLVPVVLSQLHHAFLNNIQCRFIVAHVVHGPFERALFHAFQKFG